MAKPSKKLKQKEIETESDGWERFEHAVDAAVKSGPKHRVPSSNPAPLKPHKPKKDDPPKRSSG